MKFIRQKSTGKIVYRESPHTEMTIENASSGKTPIEDLEVVDENLTDDEWNNALHNQLGYSKQRKSAYPDIGDQLDALYHAGAFPEDMATKIKAVKEKYPKGNN